MPPFAKANLFTIDSSCGGKSTETHFDEGGIRLTPARERDDSHDSTEHPAITAQPQAPVPQWHKSDLAPCPVLATRLTLFYLSAIVLIPLAGLVVRTLSLPAVISGGWQR
jgi:hypothetical protein